jgi:hypothetical protein
VLLLARGSLPFDRPAVAHLPFGSQMALPTVGMIELVDANHRIVPGQTKTVTFTLPVALHHE